MNASPCTKNSDESSDAVTHLPVLLPTLSVIIPTLNEAAALPALLADLTKQHSLELDVIVGDGGSSDATQAVALAAGARFVSAARGRGAQMNAAASQARGAYLLFLHADSRLFNPHLLAKAVSALQRAEQEQPWTAGHFRLHFIRTKRPHDLRQHDLAYRFLEAKTRLNRAGTINGDQAVLIGRNFLNHLGGFDTSLPFLEDQCLAARIHDQGCWISLPGVLATSARRFESEGLYRRYLLMGIMIAMYTVGEWAFFQRAPTVYRVQQETGRLLLTPIFRLLWSMIFRDWGLIGSLRRFYRLGGYLRENAWQIFLLIDVWRGGGSHQTTGSLLKVYDQRVSTVSTWLRFRLIDALVGLCCFGWYMVVLGGFFYAQEGLMRWIRSGQRRR